MSTKTGTAPSRVIALTVAKKLYGETVHNKFAELKNASAERCPKALGSTVKTNEIQFHHEITNQYLWSKF